MSHTRKVQSFEAVTSVAPSGLTASRQIMPLWPVKVRSSRPVRTSQSLAVRSWLPEISQRPSGVKATSPMIE